MKTPSKVRYRLLSSEQTPLAVFEFRPRNSLSCIDLLIQEPDLICMCKLAGRTFPLTLLYSWNDCLLNFPLHSSGFAKCICNQGCHLRFSYMLHMLCKKVKQCKQISGNHNLLPGIRLSKQNASILWST